MKFLKFKLKILREEKGTNMLPSLLALAIILATIIFPLHEVRADSIMGGLVSYGIKTVSEFWATYLSQIAYIALSATSWFLAFCGMLLNVSINLTLHIRDVVNSTPAIYIVWKTIRDISGLFLIFALLYAAIMQILQIRPPKFGDLIKNIVIAGILINFSFFITGVLIDASNIASLAIYRAIVPGQPDIGRILENCRVNSRTTQEKNACSDNAALNQIGSALFNDGGISALFMQSLQIQTVYNPKTINLKETQNPYNLLLKIIIIAVTGIMIMMAASLSFIIAAAAFVIRLVILVFLLAFSPVVFAASVVPGIDEYAKDWKKQLYSQLVFMPVYLILMYAALLVMSKSSIFLNGTTGGLWKGGATSALIPTEYFTFGINAAFVIIMLNLPLIAAMKLGGKSTSILEKTKLGGWATKWNSGEIWKSAGSGAYRHTVERGASLAARSKTFQTFAAKSFVGELALKGTRKVSADFDKRYEEQVKEREEFGKSLDRDKALKRTYAERLDNSYRSRLSMLGLVGRSNRVGAIQLLKNRTKEIDQEISEKRREINQINTTIEKRGGTGTPAELARLTELDEDINGDFVPGGGRKPGTGLIFEKDAVKGQMGSIAARQGASESEIRRRKY
jgi:hypothetical protein